MPLNCISEALADKKNPRDAIYIRHDIKRHFPFQKDKYSVTDVVEIIWKEKIFANGNPYIQGLLNNCKIVDKRCEDIARYFFLKYFITKDESCGKDPDKGNLEEFYEIESRLNKNTETSNDTLKDDEKQVTKEKKVEKKLNNSNKKRDKIQDKKKYNRSYVLIAATLVYIGKPNKTDYQKLKESLEDADNQYGLGIYADITKEKLLYYPKPLSEKAEEFKLKNLNNAITSINKVFNLYVDKIIELCDGKKEFKEDLQKINKI